MHRTAVVAALGLLLAACGGSTGRSAGNPADDMHAAIRRTLAVKSVRAMVTSTVTDGGTTTPPSGPTVAIYQAPNRLQSVTPGGSNAATAIRVGSTLYEEVPDAVGPQHGKYTKTDLKSGLSVAEGFFLPLIAAQGAQNVSRSGNRYHFDGSMVAAAVKGAVTGQLTVSSDYVRTIDVTISPTNGPRLEERANYTEINSAPAVTVPPREALTTLPTTPPCQNNGAPPAGLALCSGGSQPEPIDLPTPPGPVHSTLQVRPVTGSHQGSCPTPGTNPAPGALASLPSVDGELCYDLGPAGLTVAHATTSAERSMGAIALTFVLSPEDARTFDQVAQRNYQRQVAVVMFGQVLSAPTINATEFNGRGEISGLTVEMAAKVKAALSG